MGMSGESLQEKLEVRTGGEEKRTISLYYVQARSLTVTDSGPDFNWLRIAFKDKALQWDKVKVVCVMATVS